MSLIKDRDLVIFWGDSITDAYRDRHVDSDLGQGYAFMAASRFQAKYPEKNVRFLNRGISGDRVKDLQHRLEEDICSYQPNWVSILIGINDTWRKYDSNDPTKVEDYEKGLREICDRLKEGGCQLILCEPFLLPFPEDRKEWREDLDPKIRVVRECAVDYRAKLVALDGLFAEQATRREAPYWLPDGVHPSPAGHALISEAWLKAIEV